MLHFTTYQEANTHEWVTFVHGAGGSSSIWFKQIRDFKKHFNVLLLDLRGHGNSKISLSDSFKTRYTFNAIADDIKEVLDHLKITSSHFVGISLGTILIRNLADRYPNRVASMVLGGAIVKLDVRSRLLIHLGNAFKSVVPYIWLYGFLAWIIMPNKNHKESRLLFIREAKKLYQKEFMRWFKLTADLNPLLRFYQMAKTSIPTLYLMGEQDYLFLPPIRELIKYHTNAILQVVPNCGHVVNVENPQTFNQNTLLFLQNRAR